MKERTIVKLAVGLLAATIALTSHNTDVAYVAATILFFVICMLYAEWCERL